MSLEIRSYLKYPKTRGWGPTWRDHSTSRQCSSSISVHLLFEAKIKLQNPGTTSFQAGTVAQIFPVGLFVSVHNCTALPMVDPYLPWGIFRTWQYTTVVLAHVYAGSGSSSHAIPYIHIISTISWRKGNSDFDVSFSFTHSFMNKVT